MINLAKAIKYYLHKPQQLFILVEIKKMLELSIRLINGSQKFLNLTNLKL